MGMTLADFEAALPAFFDAGFPHPDPVSGNFDLVAIDRYCDKRHPHLLSASGEVPPLNPMPAGIVMDRLKGIAPGFGGVYMTYSPGAGKDDSPEAAEAARRQWLSENAAWARRTGLLP
jgi:hypothetical protein